MEGAWGLSHDTSLDLFKTIPGLPYAILMAKATALRLLPERNRGITAYYRQGFQGRLTAAESQLHHHGPTRCLLEIGCGRDLLVSLVAAVRHGKRAIAFDVAPLAELALVNFTLASLGASPVTTWQDMESRYGVRYVVASSIAAVTAPWDGAASTAAFEHIPADQFPKMVSHLRSVLSKGSVVTAAIDYRDHWSFLSPVSPDHFYGLSDTAFARINPPRMFQNRLRHAEICDCFSQAGFAIISQEIEPLALTVPRARYAPRFSHQTDEALAIGVARVAWNLLAIDDTSCASR